MATGWQGNEKRVTKAPPKQRGGHRRPGGVAVPKRKDEAAEPKKAR